MGRCVIRFRFIFASLFCICLVVICFFFFFFFFFFVVFFFFKQKTAYEIRLSLVGSEMCIRDRSTTDQFLAQLTAFGINPSKVHRNLPTDEMVAISVDRQEGVVNSTGSLSVNTGKYTGRSPDDRFIAVSYTHLTLPTNREV